MITEITPRELAGRDSTQPAPFVLDVRESWELEISRLEGAVHIPMGEVPDRLDEIPRDREVVVLCRGGGRSAQVCRFLQQQGYRQVRNLAGGILAWGEQVDPALTPY